jgi:HSP90 family molecular chaperone
MDNVNVPAVYLFTDELTRWIGLIKNAAQPNREIFLRELIFNAAHSLEKMKI